MRQPNSPQPGIVFVQLELRQTATVPAAFDAAEAALGGVIDIVVNAAGIYPCDPILEMTEDAWDRVMDVNLKGMFLVSQEFCRRLVAQGMPGAIVNITSGAAERARIGAAHYCTSKAAAEMLTRAFALEFAAHGIRVNAVSPGYVEVNSEVNSEVNRSASPMSKRSPKASRSAAPGHRRTSRASWCSCVRRKPSG